MTESVFTLDVLLKRTRHNTLCLLESGTCHDLSTKGGREDYFCLAKSWPVVDSILDRSWKCLLGFTKKGLCFQGQPQRRGNRTFGFP